MSARNYENKYLPEVPNALRDDADPKKTRQSKFETMINKIEDKAVEVHGQYTQGQTLISTNQEMMKLMYDTVTSETVKQTARDLLTPAKKLIDTLDQLGNIHPFVKVATGVFSVIVTMELKRRENDKKVAALVDTMREMMQVLAKLKDVNTAKDNADGQTLEVDLEPILKNVGAAIRKAGNTIDTYYKQKFLVKFITSSHWEEKFIELAKDFEAKKGKIDFTLSLHVTVTLDTTSETVSQIQVKVDLLLKLFQTKTAEEKQLADVIAGRNVLEDRNALDQAVKFTKSLESSDKAKKGGAPEREKDKSGRSTTDSNATMLISLKTSVNDLIAENNALFELKFESLQSAIERSEQRIITELRAGPHERILHPDVREVWKEMCWRTFVKARHFVLSLHDYYQDRISGLIKAPEGSPEMTEEEEEAKLDKERWCLQFLTAQYVSDILAAVDEDASGYIKISEANEFTSSIPPDWTLPEWLAFWAQGWHYELITYRYRLAWIWAEMFQVYQTVLPENRTIMRDYLESTPFCSVHNMIVAIQAPHSINPTASGLVEAHMALNEAKLSKILSATRYQIENSDSIQLFFGDASLEKYILPLLYLVLRHHLDLMRLGREEIFDQREMRFAEDTLSTLMSTVQDRVEFLKVCCDQRHQSSDEYLQFFAHGMYVNALGRDTEDFPDMLAEVEEYYSLQHAGVDRWDPSVTCLFTEDDFQNVKANVRLPLMDRKEGDPRWDAYFKDGLSSLGAEEREAVELYRDVILKEGDLAVYELDTNGEKEETPSTTADELLAFAQSVSEKFTEHVSVCPFLEDPATAFSELVSAELERDEKDRRIAIVFTFLSELLVLLTKCTSEHESELEPMLEGIHAQINLSRDIFDTFYIQPWFVRTWQLPQWEDRFLEMIDAFEEHKTELHKILKIDGSEPSKVSKLAVHLRTIEERRLDARIDYRGGRDTVLSKFNDIFEITQPHTGGDYDQHLALYFRVVAPIDDWISQDARINRYPINPETCNPPAMTETEEKLRDFQKARTKEDLTFYQSVAKMEFRKLPWHKWSCDNCHADPIIGTAYDCLDCNTQLCSDCYSGKKPNESDLGEHEADHHMLACQPMPLALNTRLSAEAKEIIKSGVLPHISNIDYQDESNGEEEEGGEEEEKEEKEEEEVEEEGEKGEKVEKVEQEEKGEHSKPGTTGKNIPPPYNINDMTKLIFKRQLVQGEDDEDDEGADMEQHITELKEQVSGLSGEVTTLGERLGRIELLLERLLGEKSMA